MQTQKAHTMTAEEFLATAHIRGAKITSPADAGTIARANTTLQQMQCAMLPKFMIDVFATAGSINIGSGYIFGPTDTDRGRHFPIPSIVRTNQDFSRIPQMHGKTIFGRNDLFFFAFDAFGTCFMLDNLKLNPIRKYDDPYRAMLDCLLAGKI